MEEEHTTNNGGKGGKIDTIVYNTEVAEIGLYAHMQPCQGDCFIYYSWDIVALASRRE
jgi:hypothetical protein